MRKAVLYCQLWFVWLYHIFPHYLTKGKIFRKKKVSVPKRCVPVFSTMFVSNIFHIKKNWARITIICLQVQHPLFSPDLNPLAPKSIPGAIWGRQGFKIQNLNFACTLTKERQKHMAITPTGLCKNGCDWLTHILHRLGIEPCTLQRRICVVRRKKAIEAWFFDRVSKNAQI